MQWNAHDPNPGDAFHNIPPSFFLGEALHKRNDVARDEKSGGRYYASDTGKNSVAVTLA